ncbi:MAG: hypothetical protein JXR86_04665 [Spirochaetales bacterium]|nr:hypothetical protein [Spirochaetales bacterium]
MFENIRSDMKRYEELGGWYRNLGFWITLSYRYGRWTEKITIKIIQIPFRLIYILSAIPVRMFYQVYISTKTVIGPGLLLEHPHSILIPPESKIGTDCTIYNNVTLGKGSLPGEPELADNVVVFPGARVLGGIKIGENAHIGANTVIQRSIGSWEMVLAPKSRAIPMETTKKILNQEP